MADKDPPAGETASIKDAEATAKAAEATEDDDAPQGYSQQYHYNSYGHDP
ncbi:hypothetical protein [Nocardia sp. NPDC004722]